MPKYTWEEIQVLLDDIPNLPTLPTVMINAINIAFDPDSDLNDLYKLLRNDPAITAQILKLVNSAYYGTSKEVESLKTAMVILGMEEIVRIVSAVSMADTFKEPGSSAEFDLRRFWLHSVSVGETAQSLQKRAKLDTGGEVFTAGLLHDIGSLLLATYFPEDYKLAFVHAHEHAIPLHRAEREVLGFDHGHIGGYLAEQWHLPSRLNQAVRYHHAPEEADPPSRTAALIHIADQLCTQLEFGLGEWHSEKPIEEDAGWIAANDILVPDAQLKVDTFRDHVKADIEKAKEFVQLMMF